MTRRANNMTFTAMYNLFMKYVGKRFFLNFGEGGLMSRINMIYRCNMPVIGYHMFQQSIIILESIHIYYGMTWIHISMMNQYVICQNTFAWWTVRTFGTSIWLLFMNIHMTFKMIIWVWSIRAVGASIRLLASVSGNMSFIVCDEGAVVRAVGTLMSLPGDVALHKSYGFSSAVPLTTTVQHHLWGTSLLLKVTTFLFISMGVKSQTKFEHLHNF